MFNISIEDTFETREEEFNSFPSIETWEDQPEGTIQVVTDIRQIPNGFWVACNGIGGIEINCQDKQILAYPAKRGSTEKFNYYLVHAWLPMAYQVCGAQVIHASAVVHTESHRVIVFSGESGSGKSTIAFGLGKGDNWHQIADDRLAFEIIDGKVEARFIPDVIKLRPPSAEHFQQKAFSFDEIDWYTDEIMLDSVYILEQSESPEGENTLTYSIQSLSKAEAYPKLLKHAVTLSPSLRELNQDLIQDYLALAQQVNTFALRYTPAFDKIGELIHQIEVNFFK